MPLPLDFKELLEEFVRENVEFVLIGGYAVAFYGRPRATKDIDLLLEGSPENLHRVSLALARFGAPEKVVAAIATMAHDDVVFMGHPPLRVDMLLTISGVGSSAIFEDAVRVQLDGIAMRVISLPHLIANKRAAGRPQDLVDASFLDKVLARGK